MNARTRQLLDELLVLPPEDRALIAAELEASLEEREPDGSAEEVEAAWTDEIKSRLDEVASGKVVTRDADEAHAELRARYPRQ